MLKVGVTGGIGSGKSTVCRIFKILGVPVYDSDSRARMLMNTHPDLKDKISHHFGKASYSEDGSLNRSYLADRVFSDADELEKLNALVHPAVKIDFDQWAAQQEADYVIKEAALLVETGSYRELDFLIVVTAPEEVRIDRILFRDDHRSVNQVKEILKKQYTDGEKIKYSDFLVNNDESHLIFPQILQIHTQIIEKSN